MSVHAIKKSQKKTSHLPQVFTKIMSVHAIKKSQNASRLPQMFTKNHVGTRDKKIAKKSSHLPPMFSKNHVGKRDKKIARKNKKKKCAFKSQKFLDAGLRSIALIYALKSSPWPGLHSEGV